MSFILWAMILMKKYESLTHHCKGNLHLLRLVLILHQVHQRNDLKVSPFRLPQLLGMPDPLGLVTPDWVVWVMPWDQMALADDRRLL